MTEARKEFFNKATMRVSVSTKGRICNMTLQVGNPCTPRKMPDSTNLSLAGCLRLVFTIALAPLWFGNRHKHKHPSQPKQKWDSQAHD